MFKIIFIALMVFPLASFARPEVYTDLLDYVQEAPDQGETNTCLFVASTGAMELLANKYHDIKNPRPLGRFDLAESFVINARNTEDRSFFETPVLRFNNGYGIHFIDWPFEAWSGRDINNNVWNKHPNMNKLPRVEVPEVETIKLFQYGNRWTTHVLKNNHIEKIKEALWTYQSPILVNYNDEGYWHVILIVGYNDRLVGECYDTDPKDCTENAGSFYIRDSFGVKVEVRDYEWFRTKGNAAFVVKLKN